MLAKELARRRGEKGLGQVELAALVGVSPDTYRRWEWGKKDPRAGQLVRLAVVLGTTEEKLLHGEDHEGTTPEENKSVT